MELWFKLTVLGAASGVAILMGWPHQMLIFQASAFLAAIHVFLFLLEKRDLRTLAVSSICALMDFAFIAFILGEAKFLGQYGAVAIAVLALHRVRQPLNLLALSPVSAGLIYVAMQAFGPFSRTTTLIQCAATLGGLVVIHGFAAAVTAIYKKFKPAANQEETNEFEPESPEIPVNLSQFAAVYQNAIAEQSPANPTSELTWLGSLQPLRTQTEAYPEPDMIELRENFRRTKQFCEELEEKGKKDRIAAVLVQSLTQNQESGFTNLTMLLRSIFGSRAVTLYRYQRVNDSLIVAASTLDSGESFRYHQLNISQIKSDVRLRALATNALRNPEDQTHNCPVLLKSNGELVGMLWISAETNFQLNSARDIAEESAELIANWVLHIAEIEQLRKENARHYFLESLRRVMEGAETPRTLYGRFVSELYPTLNLDHLAITMIDDEAPLTIATEGASMKAYESVKFDDKIGVDALRSSRFQPIYIEDAQDCSELEFADAIKRRVGSYAIFPIRTLNGVEAILTAGTHHRGGISLQTFESLSDAAHQLSQVVQRLEGAPISPTGIITAAELQQLMNSNAGSLILAELTDQETLLENYSTEAIRSAMRTFCNRVLNMLPNGSAVCRRDTDLVVFVPGFNSESAMSWSAELAAMAAIWNVPIGPAGSQNTVRIRTKITTLGQPSNNTNAKNTSISKSLA